MATCTIQHSGTRLKKKEQLIETIKKAENMKSLLLRKMLGEVLASRLKSRKPPCRTANTILLY